MLLGTVSSSACSTVHATRVALHIFAVFLVAVLLGVTKWQQETLLWRTQDAFSYLAMSLQRHDVEPTRACLTQGDEFYTWKEFQTCVEAHAHGGFDWQKHLHQQMRKEPRPSFPWIHPTASAVLVEFRPLEKLFRLSVQNVLDNLPVSWCIQIAGSPPVLDVVRKLFPLEISVLKIRLLDLKRKEMSQETVSAIFADRAFYEQLQGEHWLTFQIDSVICGQQRHLLKEFMKKDYGWWGAPWRNEIGEPYFGGNGGISLRQKRFTLEILERHSMVSVTNEDGWYYHHALNMLGGDDGLSRPPAPFYDAMQFSIETVMHTKPFAVHQMWNHLSPDDEMTALITNCPETLSVMPEFYLQHWSPVVCAASIDRSRFVPYENIDFNWTVCT